VNEFVHKFYRFCEGSVIFIPHAKRLVGADVAFSFDLSDGRAALCGVGVVLEQLTSADNRFGRPGIAIEIRQLQRDSRPVFEEMSTMQRAKRSVVSEPQTMTSPPSATSSVSPRTLTAIPSHRPHAVTAAIEIDSAVAIAKRSAVERSGGLSQRTLGALPIAVPAAIPSLVPPRSLEGTQPRAAGSGALFESATAGASLAQASGAIVETTMPEAATANPVVDPISASGMTSAPSSDPAERAIVEHVRWDASVAVDVSPAASSNEASPLRRRERLQIAARNLVREVHMRSRAALRAAVRQWNGWTSPRRWIVAGVATVAVVALTILLVSGGSKAPTSRVVASAGSGSGNTPGSAAETARPPVASPPAKTKKRPVAKTKRVAGKRVAGKRVAGKRIAAKPPAKKIAKKPIVKKPIVKKPAVKPTPTTPVTKKTGCTSLDCL
jgi:hypothetical protein